MAEVTITSENFKQAVLESEIPVIVDFWATWCGPCRMLAPFVAQLAEEQAGKIKVGKCNVDEEEMLAVQFGVNSIPTVIAFQGGKEVKRMVGFDARDPKGGILDLLK